MKNDKLNKNLKKARKDGKSELAKSIRDKQKSMNQTINK